MRCTLSVGTEKIGVISVTFACVEFSMYIGEMGSKAVIQQPIQTITLHRYDGKRSTYFIEQIGPAGTIKTITLEGDNWTWCGKVQVLPDVYDGPSLQRNSTLMISASKPAQLVL